MGPKQTYPTRNYEVGQYLLTLRSRAKLTQAGLASRIGVHRRSVQKWESGETYPTAENLRALIAVLIALHVFIQGQEQEEATALWRQVSEAAPQPLPRFDTAWFGQLLATPAPASAGAAPPAAEVVSAQAQAGFNLPFPLTPLVGRDHELAEITRILADPACRLLTLLGPGGIGKTRLALEIASGQTGTFSDGVVFVPLASVSTPRSADEARGASNQIISAIGEALHLSFAGQPDPTAHLLGYLRERKILLALDGFEHLLEEAGLLHDLLQETSRLTILVTSRSRLNLQAEWLFDVKGLAYPPSGASGRSAVRNLAELTNYGAVQLFVQRARQTQPDFPLPASTLTAIIHICQYVAGMPLAIELAAAGARLLPIGELERQLRSNLDGLATTLRDVPVRHRSLWAVFDQSWALLNEGEQVLFSRLAVFRGSWEQAAVKAICTQVTKQLEKGFTFTPSVLASLVDKSLVRRSYEETGAPGERSVMMAAGTPRFVLLEPIREYALEKLIGRGEAKTLQRAHAGYYLTLAEAAAAESDSATVETAIERLDYEYDNLRAALQWACEGGDLTLGLRLAGALRKFWQRRGYFSEGRLWLEQLLALENPDSSSAAVAARVQGLHVAAWLASDLHDYERATQLFEQGTVLRQSLGESEGAPHLLAPSARQARAEGQYRRAIMLLEESLARQRALGNRGSWNTGGLGLSLYELGMALREQGDFVRATTLFEECVALHQALGDREGMAVGLLGLSDVARDQGDSEQMRRYCEESLAIFRKLGVQWATGFALNNLALGAYLEADLPQALALAHESIVLFQDINNDGGLAEALLTLGQILRAQGEVVAAHEALAEALRLAGTWGHACWWRLSWRRWPAWRPRWASQR